VTGSVATQWQVTLPASGNSSYFQLAK